MTKNRYSPSVNILRDSHKELHYIPTANSRRIYDQIIESYSSSNMRSFNLVGSYGTGKSAFLLAFEKQLKEKKPLFCKLNGTFKGIKNFDIINIVGDYSSLIDSFAKKLNIKKGITAENVIDHFSRYYDKRHKENKCILIVIDEFGKHLEYAAGNDPEKEMYFVQLLAEFVNDDHKNIIFISTVHQNIDSYGALLNQRQRQEWNKVRGRLKELVFSEPVEQLLVLAANHIGNKKISGVPKEYYTVLKRIEEAKLFPLRSGLSKELALQLYPFDILAASILTLSLQKYGQNERSLFSFLLTKDYLGINDYDFKNNTFYHVSAVYDYLLHNYYSFLFTKYNPHYAQWASIRSSIERVEGLYDKDIVNVCKIIKTIGLINIFAPESSVLDKEFLVIYGSQVLGVPNVGSIIDDLQNKKIIRYALYKKKFVLFEGTDLDIELALKEAEDKVEMVSDIIRPLKKYFDFPYVSAKRIHYEKGTPRFFEYNLSEYPVEEVRSSRVDGIINLVFPRKFEKTVSRISYIGNPVVYAVYRNTDVLRNILWEIDKIQHVYDNVHDDYVARKELKNLLSYQIDLLNKNLLQSLYSSDIVYWIFDGVKVEINSHSELNRFLSQVIEKIYSATPVFKNELINRDVLPSAITVARKNFLKALVSNWDKKDLGFPQKLFPPEKMIYLTLLSATKMHYAVDDAWDVGAPSNRSDFHKVWQASKDFLESAKSRKRKLTDLYDTLLDKPFGFKKGFLSFWIPTFLFITRDEYALFVEDRYIPFVNEEILELFVKSPQKVELKSFNVEGVRLDLFHKYQSFVKLEKSKISNKSFVQIIKPFLLFYKNLPEFAKKTKNITPHAQKLREAIAKSTDPEKTFFEDFPNALGYVNLDFRTDSESLKVYIERLQEAINELKSSFDNLLDHVENHMGSILGINAKDFKYIQKHCHARFIGINEKRLVSHQKAFLYRILNNDVDRKTWLSALSQVVVGKSLDLLSDEEVPLLIERLKDAFHELDSLHDISSEVGNDEIDDAIKVSLTSFGGNTNERVIKLTKNRINELQSLKTKINDVLSTEKDINIEILTMLLRDELKK